MAKAPRPNEAADLSGYPLEWTIDVDTMAGHGTEFSKAANAEERAAIAAALGLVSCDQVAVRAHVARPGDHVFLVTGTVRANIVQSCVVTLEPLVQSVETEIEVEFRPAAHISEAEGAIDLADEIDIEPLAGHFIPMGRLVFEELAAAIDPYPRKPGAEFTGLDTGGGQTRDNPFAVLVRLKDKKSGKPEA